jgi:Nucleotide-diphospho-sugar transferase
LRLLVLSGYVGHREKYIELAIENHMRYTSMHGYFYQFVEEHNFSDEEVQDSLVATYSWLKAAKSLELLHSNEWDYIFAIDPDSIFWRMEKSLEDLILLKKDFVFAGDAWDLFNGGHFLVKNNDWSKSFLKRWLDMRSLQAPDLRTSHKSNSGRLMDQPAMNILLRSGGVGYEDITSIFNSVNGYIGNKDRQFRFFHYTHAPTSQLRLINSRKLIHSSLRQNVEVVLQDRLNGYPFRLPGKRANVSKYDILHFPGDSKDRLQYYANFIQSPTKGV